ncbi:Crp/Fnr family transcriptional regulator [Tenacibaculum sp. 1B UA]|uniref:Crp/Fnr family transcriptional regulator n=1 Tax=Tenacibaculum sp. 1B UA TaxID=2922252 RepID=UPI002A2492DA|nr:Crp/Fnr family transcriptional regulator [Tenacibaculum sp. 1B UA]MDX8553535.1 Crp/Fnr family transcriptional regulator [Tenacibaculum sp. 1B UA]
MHEFIKYIQKYISVSEELKNVIKNVVVVKDYEKGEQLVKQGKICNKTYFILQGTARVYYYLEDKDITNWVYPQNVIFTSWNSYVLRKPSSENIEVTEKSTILSLSYDDWQEIYSSYPEFERFGRMIAEENIATIDDFYKKIYFLNAKEKYEKLLQYYPTIITRANLGHIASMLGISQETLSRARE